MNTDTTPVASPSQRRPGPRPQQPASPQSGPEAPAEPGDPASSDLPASTEAPSQDSETPTPARRRRRGRRGSGSGRAQQPPTPEPAPEASIEPADPTPPDPPASTEATSQDGETPAPARRRRRGRGGSGSGEAQAEPAEVSPAPAKRREPDVTPSVTAEISFMHPSEREFANLLDYYHINYLYEPRSFPLRWDGNRVVEMHTPDFYLPEYDQYFELTTMKQNLVTQKNRKLRHLKELYPEVNIQLLYRRDLMRLMGKYGFGPLAEVSARGPERVLFSEEQIHKRVKELGKQISEEYAGTEPVLIGVLRGVIIFMADLMRELDLPVQVEFMEISHYGEEREDSIEVLRDVTTDLKGRHVILVEDIVDTGLTLRYLLEHLKGKNPASTKVCTLLDKSARRMVDVPLDYVGFEVPDAFVIGYGLDYGGRYRNLPYIGVLDLPEPKAVAQR